MYTAGKYCLQQCSDLYVKVYKLSHCFLYFPDSRLHISTDCYLAFIWLLDSKVCELEPEPVFTREQHICSDICLFKSHMSTVLQNCRRASSSVQGVLTVWGLARSKRGKNHMTVWLLQPRGPMILNHSVISAMRGPSSTDPPEGPTAEALSPGERWRTPRTTSSNQVTELKKMSIKKKKKSKSHSTKKTQKPQYLNTSTL